MTKHLPTLPSFAALAVSFAAATLFAPSALADFRLTILHINDVHSRIEPINKYDGTCRPSDNVDGKCFGGMARVKSAIDARRNALKQAGRNVLVLDAGDQFQGSLFYTQYKGSVAVDIMNRIGFDAMAVGNHEFDDGPEGLVAFAKAAKFPILFANVKFDAASELANLIKPYVIKSFGPDKVGIIGLLAEDTSETSSPGKSVAFLKAEDALKTTIADLKGQGVDKIVVLSHVGINRDIAIAKAVAGIDVIVGGHSHTLLDKYPTVITGPDGKPVQIVQAYAYSKYLGELTVTFDDKGDVKSASGAPWLLNAAVPEDAELAKLIAAKAQPLEAIKSKVVGVAGKAINGDRRICRAGVCEMGVLVAEAMLDRVKGQGIQIAVQNGGGLRASIDAGSITMGELLTVLPFQNTLATFQLKGTDVIAALENGVSKIEDGAGRFPQVAGLKYTFDAKAAAGSRISNVMVAGPDGSFAPIDPTAVYGVVSNNYMRGGGDGYAVFRDKAMNAYDYGPNLEQVVADYLGKIGGTYEAKVDDRIIAK